MNDMTNNRVVIRFNSPIILLDGKLNLNEVFKQYDGDSFIKKSSGIYHLSDCLIENYNRKSGRSVIKDNIDPANLPCTPVKSLNIDVGSGVWQSYKRTVIHEIVTELEFYCCAKADRIRDTLMNMVSYLGNFSEFGYGEIGSVDVTVMSEDYSFFKDGILNRSIPVGVAINVDSGSAPLNPLSYAKAYDDCYQDGSLILCYMPN